QEPDDLGNEHCAEVMPAHKIKKRNTKDLLTIFTDRVRVKFVIAGKVDLLWGRWCMICKEDEIFVRKNGKRKAFHLGSNSSCRQHIRIHYEEYQQRCVEGGIPENDHAVPREI
ncbi:hypothetical protein SCLCIDRAFT_55519, partial [Scleroderma citrinum Foug A]